MRKFLVWSITFFLLGSNVVWAFDAGDLFQEHEKQKHSVSVASSDPNNNNLEYEADDHCCHSTSHFIGILFSDSITITRSNSQSVMTSSKPHTSQAYQPPLPPPNA
jgi:hypothetical protein